MGYATVKKTDFLLRHKRVNNLLSIEVDTFSGPKFYEKGDFQY
jgi:hypothetical protein